MTSRQVRPELCRFVYDVCSAEGVSCTSCETLRTAVVAGERVPMCTYNGERMQLP